MWARPPRTFSTSTCKAEGWRCTHSRNAARLPGACRPPWRSHSIGASADSAASDSRRSYTYTQRGQLAASTGAALFPLSIRQASRADGGYGIECIFHDEVVVPRAEGAGRPDPDVIRAATQACIAALGTTIAAEPHQWHMMQPVFTVDLDPARSR